MPEVSFITDRLADPLLDAAASNAILRRVAAGEMGPALRLFVPERTVAFGSQDRTRAGYAAAVAAVSDLGFAPIERLAGGRAAVFHEGTLAFAWAIPDADPKRDIESRFEMVAGAFVAALRDLGVSATVGEVPGEYCPGRFSVQVAGRKVMGVGQRLVSNAAHIGGVLVVHSPELINGPLHPAYRLLGYEWDPAATGALSDTAHVEVDQAAAAIGTAFEALGYTLRLDSLSAETVRLAEGLAARHSPPGIRRG